MTKRSTTIVRETRETRVVCSLDLDTSGATSVASGLPFLDHMLESWARHAGVGLSMEALGDLHVDDHHTVEDCGIVLGQAIDAALGDKSGIARFGHAYAPLDESLARSVVDLSGRPWPVVNLGLQREQLGGVATENVTHFFCSLAISARLCLHLDVLRGTNDHHRAEAAFKSFALAFGRAAAVRGSGVPSTKGVL